MLEDGFNGILGVVATSTILITIYKLYKEKLVRGISIYQAGFFMCLSYWNIYYYLHLNQLFSFYSAFVLSIASTIWVIQIVYYNAKERIIRKLK